MFHSLHPVVRGVLFGAVITVVGVSFVALFQYVRTGDVVNLYREDRLSLAGFFFERGNYYFGGGAYNLDQAEKEYRRALSFNNVYKEPIYYQIGRIYFIKGELAAALGEFDKQLAADSGYKRTHYMRGLTYGYLHRYDEAEAEFKQFISWKPDSWAAHNDLVWVYFLEGDYENAEYFARQGLQQAAGNPWLSNALGAILLNNGEYKEAEQHLLVAESGFNSMSSEQWGRAYPGNDPRVYREGQAASLASVSDNLRKVREKLGSE